MRASGILMPIFSLPGPYGIGTLGQAAYDFVDFLARRDRPGRCCPLAPPVTATALIRAFLPLQATPILSTESFCCGRVC